MVNLAASNSDWIMADEKINLNAQPAWLRYSIAIVITATIAAVGWYFGRNRPVPHWIQAYLIPGLAWFGLLLIVLAVVDWIRRRRSRR